MVSQEEETAAEVRNSSRFYVCCNTVCWCCITMYNISVMMCAANPHAPRVGAATVLVVAELLVPRDPSPWIGSRVQTSSEHPTEDGGCPWSSKNFTLNYTVWRCLKVFCRSTRGSFNTFIVVMMLLGLDHRGNVNQTRERRWATVRSELQKRCAMVLPLPGMFCSQMVGKNDTEETLTGKKWGHLVPLVPREAANLDLQSSMHSLSCARPVVGRLAPWFHLEKEDYDIIYKWRPFMCTFCLRHGEMSQLTAAPWKYLLAGSYSSFSVVAAIWRFDGFLGATRHHSQYVQLLNSSPVV